MQRFTLSSLALPTLGRMVMLASIGAAPLSYAEELPAPVQALRDQGLSIHGQFEAPGGLRGYGASVQGQDMAIYLTPDGEHAIVDVNG